MAGGGEVPLRPQACGCCGGLRARETRTWQVVGVLDHRPSLRARTAVSDLWLRSAPAGPRPGVLPTQAGRRAVSRLGAGLRSIAFTTNARRRRRSDLRADIAQGARRARSTSLSTAAANPQWRPTDQGSSRDHCLPGRPRRRANKKARPTKGGASTRSAPTSTSRSRSERVAGTIACRPSRCHRWIRAPRAGHPSPTRLAHTPLLGPEGETSTRCLRSGPGRKSVFPPPSSVWTSSVQHAATSSIACRSIGGRRRPSRPAKAASAAPTFTRGKTSTSLRAAHRGGLHLSRLLQVAWPGRAVTTVATTSTAEPSAPDHTDGKALQSCAPSLEDAPLQSFPSGGKPVLAIEPAERGRTAR